MFDCVMLAAGASSRMGGAGGDAARPAAAKPLLPFAGGALAEAAVRAALGAGCRVLLVVGNRGDEVAALFRAEGRVLAVRNPHWEEGMVGSIQAALPEVRGEAFFVALADMPFVRPADYAALAAALEARAAGEGPSDDPAALFASFRGRAGHPVLLPSAWAPGILALGRGGMLRDFVGQRPRELVETGPGALSDVDTPADYAAAIAAIAGAEAPAGGPGADPAPA